MLVLQIITIQELLQIVYNVYTPVKNVKIMLMNVHYVFLDYTEKQPIPVTVPLGTMKIQMIKYVQLVLADVPIPLMSEQVWLFFHINYLR